MNKANSSESEFKLKSDSLITNNQKQQTSNSKTSILVESVNDDSQYDPFVKAKKQDNFQNEVELTDNDNNEYFRQKDGYKLAGDTEIDNNIDLNEDKFNINSNQDFVINKQNSKQIKDSTNYNHNYNDDFITKSQGKTRIFFYFQENKKLSLLISILALLLLLMLQIFIVNYDLQDFFK